MKDTHRPFFVPEAAVSNRKLAKSPKKTVKANILTREEFPQDVAIEDLALEVAGTGTPMAPSAHHTSHENGGADEISVTGLSGLLADAQTPLAHATSHKSGGSDQLRLHEFADPTGSVQFAQQQSLQFRLENRTSDPGSPVAGQIWLRVDL